MVCISLGFSSQSHSFGHQETQAWNKKIIYFTLQKQTKKKAHKNNRQIRQYSIEII